MGNLLTVVAINARRALIAKVLTHHGGNVQRTARELEISPPHLYRQMTALGIDPARYRRAKT